LSWTSQGRDLPTNWRTIRRAILQRDQHRCTWIQTDGTRCPETTRLEVDHIANPNDHRPDNLRTLCHWHHARVTAAQSHRAKQAKTPTSQHPGLV
jgi:5-methylcytosine-specific restriction endonuclease McrA